MVSWSSMGTAGVSPSRHRLRVTRAVVAALVLCVPLAGCGGGSMADLRDYVADVKTEKVPEPDAIPRFEPQVVYTYPCDGSVACLDPFEPFFQEPPTLPEEQQVAGSGIQPDFDRNREELESHALDSLRMMGTLEKAQEMWGIVRSPDSIIHRVQVGNFMGKNYGKIIDISEEKIELMEIIPDGQGGWMERDAGLALAE